MKGLIEYFIKFPAIGNILMFAILVFGFVGLGKMKRNYFPEIESKNINIITALPGASPEEIEEGIVQKIEENLVGIPGIDRITSTSSENTGNISVEIKQDYDANDLILDIQNGVNSISSFPSGMEPPRVFVVKPVERAIKLVITGETDLKTLKKYARSIEEDLLELEEISQVTVSGFPMEEIEIAIRENDLRKFNITLEQVRNIVASQNLDITGGTIRTPNEELLIRARLKEYFAENLEDKVILTTPQGQILRLSDVASVTNKWSEVPSRDYYNGNAAVTITVNKTTDEDLLKITDSVKEYVDEYEQKGDSIQLIITDDRSISLRQRIDLLTKNGIQGFFLVCIMLALFLNWRIAFWVAISIPVSFAGMFIIGAMIGVSINVISLFGLILVLGILVDDGIVISENIYQKYEEGASRIKAAVDGTIEVLPAVISAVLTTVIAFSMFYFIEGRIGDIFKDVATVVLLTLTFSLVEGALILPAHIGHSKALLKNNKPFLLTKIFYGLLYWLRDKLYVPSLKFSLRYPLLIFGGFFMILLATFASLGAGIIKNTFYPPIPRDNIDVVLKMPSGTRESITLSHLKNIEDAIWRVNENYKKELGESINVIKSIGTTLGPATHAGSIDVNLLEGDERGVSGTDITNEIRKETGEIPGSEQLTFGVSSVFGKPVSISLISRNAQELDIAVAELKNSLTQMTSLKDIVDTNTPGIREVKVTLKDLAYTLGLTERDVLQQIRSGFFGTEVQRIQRGKDEVKIWVRYDEEDRSSLSKLEQLKIKTTVGEYSFSQIASYSVERGITKIDHIDGKRQISVDAALANDNVSASEILEEIKTTIIPVLQSKYPSVKVKYEGQNRQIEKNTASIKKVFPIILSLMFLVIAFTFRSYVQPILVLLLIPFGLIGVVWGHWFVNYLDQFIHINNGNVIMVSFFSYIGLIALVGIMVNDALVFITAFNQYLQKGYGFTRALFKTAISRFRPIILTSLTTIVGLLPLLWESSFQAQFLKPMAISISFGLLFVTIIILILLPVYILFYNNTKRLTYASFDWVWNAKWSWKKREAYEPAIEELKDADLK